VSDPFVLASYLATYGLIVGYAVSLAVRIRRAKRRD
jgi:hypothetical protein